jgi:trimeric autotransporter adhesin
MISVGRAHSIFQFCFNIARNLSCTTELRISSLAKASRLLRWAIGLAALSALAACQQDSSSGQTANSDPNSAGTSKPAVTLAALKSSVAMGTAATLQWSTTDAQSCTASGGWTGSQPTSGSATTDPLTAPTSYTLTCTGPGGSSSRSADVVVLSPAPEVTLTASPATVGTSGTSSLSWKSSNATACTASGGWSGPVAASGTWSTEALSNTTIYELTCTGTGGSATQSSTVTVSALAPVITLGANPSSVDAGGTSVLSWSTGNAMACTASGAWSGGKTLAGSQSSGALTASATYTLICTGVRGTASQSVTVSVKSLAPSVSIAATPSTIANGTSSTLKWTVVKATSCSASGAWSGNKAASGSQSTGILGADATYTLTCSGPGGEASQSATVSIKSPTPTVTLSVGPSAITSGNSATLNWSATNATSCVASGAWSCAEAVHGSQSTGALKANATYILTCTGAGGTAAQSATVSVSAHPSVSVSLSASPSTVASGGTSKLTWSSINATACTASGGWSGTKGISGSQSSAALTASTSFGLTCTGNGGSASQSVTVSVTSAAPAVQLTASPSTVASGGTSTLSWSSSNATSCAASGAWAGARATSGSQTTGALTASATYGLSCTGSGGSALQSATVSVTSPAPTIIFTASPSTVASGSGSTLIWSATYATSCTASGAWSGTKAVTGSQSTGVLTANETYGLICTGAGGSATQSATVSVTKAAPAIVLSASPSTVKSGAATSLTWSSTNATSCIASGGWSGNQSTSGSKSTSALTATTSFMLTCTGTGGSASQSVTVTVSAAPPSVSLSAGPASVARGGSSTLTWSSTNATACTASGGWTGSLATGGAKATGAVNATTTYTLSCTGTGGTATQSAIVAVTTSTSGGTATVTWVAPTINTDGTPVTNLSGYTIYYGTSQSDLTQSVVVSGAATLNYEVNGLASGTWYFAVAADASDGTQSAMSNVGSKTL